LERFFYLSLKGVYYDLINGVTIAKTEALSKGSSND